MKQRLIFILLGFFVSSDYVLAQGPTDSLTCKVGIFKYPFIGAPDSTYPASWMYTYPRASGFFFKSDDTSLYIVTARHVFLPSKGETAVTAMFVPDRHLPLPLISCIFTPRPNKCMPDSLADVDVFPLGPTYSSSRSYFDKAHCWFSETEIASETQMNDVKVGDSAFYIGAYPDSINSWTNWYLFSSGIVRAIAPKPVTLVDRDRRTVTAARHFLEIVGRPGISGSPVIRKTTNAGYQLIGVISGVVTDSTSPYNRLSYFTAAHKILDLVKSHCQ